MLEIEIDGKKLDAARLVDIFWQEKMEFDGKKVEELYDRVLVAVGRTPCSDDLELENTKVALDEKNFVKINENIRGHDVYIIQSTCPPTNHHLMELLIMIDAARRASAARITAVLPFYGYARQDRKDQPRVPITARLIADMIQVAGANRILTLDLHQGQLQGFFNIPVDELTAVHLLSNYIKQRGTENLAVVTDLGFAKRARTFAEILDAPLAIVEKRREGNNDHAEVLNVIGDVKGKRVIIVDDVLATGGTVAGTLKLVEQLGAIPVAISFLAELPALGGRARLPDGIVSALVAF